MCPLSRTVAIYCITRIFDGHLNFAVLVNLVMIAQSHVHHLDCEYGFLSIQYSKLSIYIPIIMLL